MATDRWDESNFVGAVLRLPVSIHGAYGGPGPMGYMAWIKDRWLPRQDRPDEPELFGTWQEAEAVAQKWMKDHEEQG